jgi:hypothetical protein
MRPCHRQTLLPRLLVLTQVRLLRAESPVASRRRRARRRPKAIDDAETREHTGEHVCSVAPAPAPAPAPVKDDSAACADSTCPWHAVYSWHRVWRRMRARMLRVTARSGRRHQRAAARAGPSRVVIMLSYRRIHYACIRCPFGPWARLVVRAGVGRRGQAWAAVGCRLA